LTVVIDPSYGRRLPHEFVFGVRASGASGLTRQQSEKESAVSSIALVHGGFVDGSGWEAVYQILRKSGHAVTVVQNPTTSLADDVAVTKRALDQQLDQTVLVGHSYGGAVITEAGNHPG
jgi:pimeloyl-ACP methyl ester carboxylesterase